MNARRSSEAFEELVREHHAAVYRAAQRIVLNADDAQDVTQQVFLQALEQRDRLDGAENPRAVLCWMASRTALMHLRGDRRRRQREAERAVMNRDDQTGEVGVEQDERAVFGGIFRRLPEELRVALSLRFQEEMTYEEIGDVMTVSVASAHDRVRRGLERLREALRRGGLAAFAVDVEAHLAEAPAEPVPTGLVERLLELKPVTLASSGSLLLGGALVAAAVVAGVLGVTLGPAAGSGSPDEPVVRSAVGERSDLALPSADEATSSRVDVGGSMRDEVGARRSPGEPVATAVAADTRNGTISGRITVPDGGPAEGVTVVASSFVLAGKMAAWGGRSATDANGRYEIVVPVRHDDGEDYRVYVKYDEATITRARDARVPPGGSVAGFDIELERPLDERDGEFELHLEVRDEAGLLLPADSILILERHLRTVGDGTWPRWEASGRLDGAGTVVLRGAKLGPKRVTARVRGDEQWRSYTATFELSAGGRTSRSVTVAAERNDRIEYARNASRSDAERPEGYSLSGHMSELVGGAPVLRSYPDVWVYPVPELSSSDYLYDFLPNKLFRCSFQTAAFGEDPDPTSRFVMSGLQLGRWVAVGYEHPYAPVVSDLVELTAEAPAAEGLQLRYEEPGQLTGVVLDVDGKPAAGAIVFITGTGPISTEATEELDGKIRKSSGEGVFIEPIRRADEQGRFTIAGLPSNVPVRVVAFHPERAPAASPTVYATSGATVEGLDLRFSTRRTR